MTGSAVLELRQVSKSYRSRSGGFLSRPRTVHAVSSVTLSVEPNEILGIVGESGSGKSTIGRLALGLTDPTVGTVLHEGRDLAGLSASQWRKSRKNLQMIFQDALGSLNPRMRIGRQIIEALKVHGIGSGGEEQFGIMRDILDAVGLPGMTFAERFPSELSGGQRQRVVIARALALRAGFIVCDEPVSALDVSTQAQILNLLLDLRERFGLSYLFISHDMRVVRQVCTRVAVMYLGRIVEIASTEDMFAAPRHPYTRSLIASVPLIHGRRERAVSDLTLRGELPDPADMPEGCPFHPRCGSALPICKTTPPELRTVAGAHQTACHVVDVQ